MGLASGTGTPRREFLYSDDIAEACLYLLEQPEEKLQPLFSDKQPPLVNVGCGEDLTIHESAELVMEVVGSTGNLAFDPSKTGWGDAEVAGYEQAESDGLEGDDPFARWHCICL